MKKITLTSFVLALLFSSLNLNTLFAQAVLREISLKQQVEKSSLIIEGKVISKQSFWDAKHHNIYTANTVKVYKVFKGQHINTIEVITPGGSVGFQAQRVSPSLELRNGDIGVFMLYDNNVAFSTENKSANKRFKPYSSVQGFYKYNVGEDVAVNPFSAKRGISNSFYNEIKSYTKLKYIEVSKFEVKEKSMSTNQKKNVLALGITSFSSVPTPATAGTKTVLTITGTDFGGTKGKVGFSDANDGGATFIDALDTQVLTWGNTEITVEIPSDAGTGKIRVTHDDTSTVVSASDLTITYAELNVISSFWSVGGATDYAYETRHIDDPESPASGGYTWEMFTDFFADTEVTGAKASFERALETWRCETKVNWEISGSATTVDVIASDGTNVIRFDNGDEGMGGLPDGVLGRCTSRLSGCGDLDDPDSAIYHVTELDIVFDDVTSWETGPSLATGSDVDFESVALHELGHGHQLGHVIESTGAVMHYALSAAENIRTLTVDDIAGAGDVHSRSTTIDACLQDVMVDYDTSGCALSISENELGNAIKVFPNPASGKFYISNASFINLEKVIIYDISGRLISENDISNTSRIKTITLGNVSKGMYFVSIYSENTVITKKIILE